MNQKKHIMLLVAVLVFLVCILIQSGFVNRNSLLAVESRTSKTVTKQAKTKPKDDPKTVDVSDIVVKEHNWVSDGYRVQWTPDGKYVVFCRTGTEFGFYVMDPMCQNIRSLGKGMYFEGMSPDGRILYGSWPKDGSPHWRNPAEGLSAINIKDGSVKQIASVEFKGSYWSPSGKHVIVFATGGNLLINTDGTGFKTLKGASWKDWSPDGSKFICQARDGSIYLFNVDGSSAANIAKMSNGWVNFIKNTKKVWLHDWTTNNITLVNIDGTDAKIVAQTKSEPMFSPSGNWLIYKDLEDDAHTIMMLTDGKKTKLNLNVCDYVIWFPDEKHVIIPTETAPSSPYWKWYLLSLDTPDSVGKLLNAEEPWNCLSLSPDSRFIAITTGQPMRLGIANVDGTKCNILTEIGLEGLTTYNNPIVWSPLNNAIAYGSRVSHESQRVGVVILGRKGSQ